MTTGPGSAVDVSGKPSAAEPARHGSHAGIKRHRQAHQPLCDDCRTFERAYRRDYYRTRASIEAYRLADNAAAARRMARRRAADIESWRQRQRTYRQRRRAAALHDLRHGIDEVVVTRLVNGEPTHYNRAERLEAVRRLRDRGLAYRQIAERLHVEDRQVHRDLTALGLVAVAS